MEPGCSDATSTQDDTYFLSWFCERLATILGRVIHKGCSEGIVRIERQCISALSIDSRKVWMRCRQAWTDGVHHCQSCTS